MDTKLLGSYLCTVTKTANPGGWFEVVCDDDSDNLEFHLDDIQPEELSLFKLGAKLIYTIERVRRGCVFRQQCINFIKED